MPPPYASIPRRPAIHDLEASAAPSAGHGQPAAQDDAQFKLVAKRSQPENAAWGIQVGAFRQIAPAQVAAEHAAQRLPSDLRQARINISPMADKEGRVFRARLMGFDEADARRACSRLEALKISCYVVTPAASG
ncbi:MAG: SPOR domain-containing protein [Kiloniellales bacterium]